MLCDNLEAWGSGVGDGSGVQERGDMCVPVGDSGGREHIPSCD